MKDYYEILQVHPNATQEIIAKAYRTLVARHHPDKHQPEDRSSAEDVMKQLNEAYTVLSDPEKRRNYDASLSRNPAFQAYQAPGASARQTITHAPRVRVQDTTQCVIHPERARVSTCSTCRTSLCSDCRVFVLGSIFCSTCAPAETWVPTAKVRPAIINSKPKTTHALWLWGTMITLLVWVLIIPLASISQLALVVAMASSMLFVVSGCLWIMEVSPENPRVEIALRVTSRPLAKELVALAIIAIIICGVRAVQHAPAAETDALFRKFVGNYSGFAIPVQGAADWTPLTVDEVYKDYPWISDQGDRPQNAQEFLKVSASAGANDERRKVVIHYLLVQALYKSDNSAQWVTFDHESETEDLFQHPNDKKQWYKDKKTHQKIDAVKYLVKAACADRDEDAVTKWAKELNLLDWDSLNKLTKESGYPDSIRSLLDQIARPAPPPAPPPNQSLPPETDSNRANGRRQPNPANTEDTNGITSNPPP